LKEARPSLRDLDCLAALLDLRSSRRVAEKLGMSQPAVSHALRRLRATFSDPLFVRDGAGLRPTQRALELRHGLNAVTAAVDQLVLPATFDPAALSRTFRIASVDYLQARLAASLSATLQNLPGVSLAIAPLMAGHDMFANGRIDLVVTLSRLASPRHRIRNLAEDSFAVLLRAGHPLRTAGIDLKAFTAASHVLVSPLGQAMHASVDEALAALGLSRQVKLAVSSFWSAALLVTRSDLLATVPARFAAVACEALDLALLPLPLDLPRMTLSMIWEEARHGDPAHAWLRGLVLEAFSKDHENSTRATA
jgi:DNA-binding transcriptional LysR family regulator